MYACMHHSSNGEINKGYLGVFPDPMRGSGAGMSMCTDGKALRDKFVICEIGLYK